MAEPENGTGKIRAFKLHGQTRIESFLFLAVLLIGLHSIFLAIFIYFFPNYFYNLFFSVDVENIFFVRQTGVFLFCLGSYYLLPLVNLQKNYRLVRYTIFTKILAVLFLVVNAGFTLSPPAIYLAAVGDGAMAVVLTVTLFHYGKVSVPVSES